MTETVGRTRPARSRSRLAVLLGRQPLGIVFSAPYAVFLALVFAYPLGLAVWMSFHDYFFAAPGVEVERPFVGLENYQAVLGDPAVREAFLNVVEFLLINVPATVLLSLVLASALNGAIRGRTFLRVAYFAPYVTASVALVAVWLFLFSQSGMVNQVLGPLAPDPSWLVNSTLAMPVIASDGIQETDVTDDSMRILEPYGRVGWGARVRPCVSVVVPAWSPPEREDTRRAQSSGRHSVRRARRGRAEAAP
jgi:multiple sugar transport system permease protein